MLQFILGYSIAGLLIGLTITDTRNDILYIIVSGPLVWLIFLMHNGIYELIHYYIKRKYNYILYYNKATDSIRVANTRDKEEANRQDNEYRLTSVYLLKHRNTVITKEEYNKIDIFLAEKILHTHLPNELKLTKKQIKNFPIDL